MEAGFIGLGRMGAAMVARLVKGKHRIVAYDQDAARVKAVARRGARGADSLAHLMQQLRRPHVIWLMVPAGAPVATVLRALETFLEDGDLVIDAGNYNYRDSIQRARSLRTQSIHFLDAGTSGGIRGAERGFCLMVGGDPDVFRRAEPLFRALATRNSYALVGPSGAGHFAKMVHNAIEYGMLEAYGEGFEMLAASDFRLDLRQLARLWNNGSVIRSWLLELAGDALDKDGRLRKIRGHVEDSGEGRWSVIEAVERGIPAPALALALFSRFRSRQKDSFAGKLIAALRQEFGGHKVKGR